MISWRRPTASGCVEGGFYSSFTCTPSELSKASRPRSQECSVTRATSLTWLWASWFFVLFGHATWCVGSLLSNGGLKPIPSAVRALSPNHWTTREFPTVSSLRAELHLQPALFPDSKESACNAGDLGSIPGSGRFPGEGNGYPRWYSSWTSPWTEESDEL